MRLLDITHRLSATIPIYPGNAPFRLDPVKRISEGASSNVSLLHVGTHTGTHVDAPSHFVPGAATVDELPLDVLIGPARVIHVPVRRALEPADLELLQAGDQRVLIRTANGALWESAEFTPDYAALSGEAARHLVRLGVRLVGVDYLSVERFKAPGAPAHHALLGAGVVIVEGLDLRTVEPGVYDMICLPLPVTGAEAAPARVILRAP